jgi:hypothetical protein
VEFLEAVALFVRLRPLPLRPLNLPMPVSEIDGVIWTCALLGMAL